MERVAERRAHKDGVNTEGKTKKGAMWRQWRENRFESAPKQNKEGWAKKSDRMKNAGYHTQPEAFWKKCESKQRDLPLEAGEKWECGEQTLFHSHLLRNRQAAKDVTGIFALLLATPPLHTETHLPPTWQLCCVPICVSILKFQGWAVTEPCNGEIFAVAGKGLTKELIPSFHLLPLLEVKVRSRRQLEEFHLGLSAGNTTPTSSQS